VHGAEARAVADSIDDRRRAAAPVGDSSLLGGRTRPLDLCGKDVEAGERRAPGTGDRGAVGKPAVEIPRNSHTVTAWLESGEELGAEELPAAVGRRSATIVGEVPLDRLWHATPSFPAAARSGCGCARPTKGVSHEC
jgi:hypothetical protein